MLKKKTQCTPAATIDLIILYIIFFLVRVRLDVFHVLVLLADHQVRKAIIFKPK